MARKPYQGHESYAAWNVAVYLFNEYPLYQLVMEAIAGRTLAEASTWLMARLPERTPDGVRYSLNTVRLALVGVRES